MEKGSTNVGDCVEKSKSSGMRTMDDLSKLLQRGHDLLLSWPDVANSERISAGPLDDHRLTKLL